MEEHPDRKEPHKEPRRGSTRKLARDRVFDVAADLFYREGVRAVGVDAIVKKAGVAKISLYRTFPSKDDLVLAYLKDRQSEFWRQWDEAFGQHQGDPRGTAMASSSGAA